MTLSPKETSARFGSPQMPEEYAYQPRPPNNENLDANIAYLHQQAYDLHEQNALLAGQKAAMASMNPFLTQGPGSNVSNEELSSPSQTCEFLYLPGQNAPQTEFPLQQKLISTQTSIPNSMLSSHF